MKPADIQKKARAKANAMEPKTKQYEFVDKVWVAGSCTVTIPAEKFSYIISRKVAENLLAKHGGNLPFEIMHPKDDVLELNDDWKEVTKSDFNSKGEIPRFWSIFEIWLPAITDDLHGMFQSPKAQ